MHQKYLFLFLLCLGTSFATRAQTQAAVVAPVKLQLEGYNNRDIELFVSAYSDTVKVYRHPGVLTYQGKEELRKRYSQLFAATPELHCDVVNRIVAGNVVIDHEKVQRGKNQPRLEAIAVYRVRHNKIVEVTFISPESGQ